MSDDLSAIDWLVIVCALALGFGVVKFTLVAWQDSQEEKRRKSAAPPAPPDVPPA